MTKPDFTALAARADIEVLAEQDETPVRGNAMASGDDAEDRRCEDWVLAELDNGNVWAWAAVTVIVRYGDFSGVAYLGCCSYDSEADFRTGGYFEQMVEDARADLIVTLERAWDALHGKYRSALRT